MYNPVLSRSTTRLKERVSSNNGNKPGFLYQQNSFLKLLITLTGINIALFSRWEYFLVIYLITLLWLAVDLKIIRHYSKILLSLSPFITSYLVLGLIFRLTLREQFIFIGRIILLLLFSVYLIKTTRRSRLLAETALLRRWKFIKDLFVFSLATGKFVQIFFLEIKRAKKLYRKIDDLPKIIVEAFHNVYLRVEEIENEIYQAVDNRVENDSEFFNWANVYLTFLLTTYIIVLAM